MIQFLCPNCATALEIDDALAGREVTCGACGATAIAPARAWLAPVSNRAARWPVRDEHARPLPGWVSEAVQDMSPAMAGDAHDTEQVDVELVPVPHSPRSATRQGTGGTGAIKILAIVAAVLVVGTLAGAVAFVLFGRTPRVQAPTASKAARNVALTVDNGKIASSKQQRGPQNKTVKTRLVTIEDLQKALDLRAAEQKEREERAWLREAQLEVADAIEDRKRRIHAINMQLGGMNRGEFNRSRAALKFIVDRQSLKGVPSKMVDLAARIDPGIIKWLQDEMLIQSGAAPDLAERKELFLQLEGIVGKAQVRWYLFDVGTNQEIAGLIHTLHSGVFRDLTKRQRLILLGAGAIDYIGGRLRTPNAGEPGDG